MFCMSFRRLYKTMYPGHERPPTPTPPHTRTHTHTHRGTEAQRHRGTEAQNRHRGTDAHRHEGTDRRKKGSQYQKIGAAPLKPIEDLSSIYFKSRTIQARVDIIKCLKIPIQPAEADKTEGVGISRPRGFEAKILESRIGTMNIESGVCDLPPEGSNQKRVVAKFATRGIH